MEHLSPPRQGWTGHICVSGPLSGIPGRQPTGSTDPFFSRQSASFSPLWGEVRSGGGSASLRSLRVAQPPPPPTPPQRISGRPEIRWGGGPRIPRHVNAVGAAPEGDPGSSAGRAASAAPLVARSLTLRSFFDWPRIGFRWSSTSPGKGALSSRSPSPSSSRRSRPERRRRRWWVGWSRLRRRRFSSWCHAGSCPSGSWVAVPR